jgi:hypothetical protein
MLTPKKQSAAPSSQKFVARASMSSYYFNSFPEHIAESCLGNRLAGVAGTLVYQFLPHWPGALYVKPFAKQRFGDPQTLRPPRYLHLRLFSRNLHTCLFFRR